MFFRAKIIRCTDPKNYWYREKIGEIVFVRKWTPNSWGVEEKITGGQVAPHDYERIK